MAESIVSDWLADFTSLQEDELKTFAAQHEHNHEVAAALFSIFNERLKYPDLVHSICNQFHGFYRSNEVELRRFTLQFTPVLIYIYLSSVSQGDKKSSRSIETLLISIYNIETTENDQPKVVSFRMPILAQASIYHEEKMLNAIDLRRWEQNSNREVKWGPMPQVESLNAQNRLKVMTALLFVYNQQLSLIQKPALYHLCRMTSQIVNQGFTRVGHAHRTSYGSDPNSAITPKPPPRIPVSSQFLIELLHAVYFAMFNEFASFAIQTVDDVHHRACYEMFTDCILVTNAIKNSLHANPSGQPSDGPMGISVALTPVTTTVTVSKSMITNASFRTKKLPDDLEMEFVTALEAQQLQSNNSNNHVQPSSSGVHTQPSQSADHQSHGSPKDQTHKHENPKSKRWKTWGWKYSPGSKTASIEEEPESPKRISSRQSSPAQSPKHNCNGVGNKMKQPLSVTGAAAASAAGGGSSGNGDGGGSSADELYLQNSPVRRKKSSSPHDSPTKRAMIRASAGARLYQMLDDSSDDPGDELQSLLCNGRPASVHIVQLSSSASGKSLF